ncbi:hypothetical protein F8M41_019346 [Gigaspora margarita]|uniref:Uncharacterized protein n=1 Tax=Gigaspora margarita TaxID=4874 RepID=A0A8H4EVJ3_GIGMA|nr:hypothetical protein F8M41_019346 [Gigaspora margarita]
MEKQMNEFVEKTQIKEIPFNYFIEETIETISTELTTNSYKTFSEKYDKTMISNKFVFSQKYTFKDFIINNKKLTRLTGKNECVLQNNLKVLHENNIIHMNLYWNSSLANFKWCCPFESESSIDYDLLNVIIHVNAKMKFQMNIILATQSRLTPSIQRVFEDLNALDSSNDMMENNYSQIPDD